MAVKRLMASRTIERLTDSLLNDHASSDTFLSLLRVARRVVCAPKNLEQNERARTVEVSLRTVAHTPLSK